LNWFQGIKRKKLSKGSIKKEMKIGRNDPCPCGSGKKYKKCCLNKTISSNDFFYRRLSSAYQSLTEQLLEFSISVFGEEIIQAATLEFLFFDKELVTVEMLEHLSSVSIPWIFFDWFLKPEPGEEESDPWAYHSIAEIYLMEEEDELDALEKRILEACTDAPFSFYEVISLKSGSGMRLRDILCGYEYNVTEKMGSRQLKLGDILFARVIKIDDIYMLAGSSPVAIPPRYKPIIIGLRNYLREGIEIIDDEILFEYDDEIRFTFLQIYHEIVTPPELCNSDGEPIVFHKLIYEIDDPEETFKALLPLCPAEDEETLRNFGILDDSGRIIEIEFPWLRKGHKLNPAMDNTILGTIKIKKDRMVVEVNSKQRADSIKAEIESRLGNRAKYRATEVTSQESLLKNTESKDLPPTSGKNNLLNAPEIRGKLEQMISQPWEEWIDQPIPFLEGKTPREAVKSPEGKESVEALLLDAERTAVKDKNMGEFELRCITKVRKKLKLGKKKI